MRQEQPHDNVCPSVRSSNVSEITNLLSAVNQEVVEFVRNQDSLSQLSFCVNDSAFGKSFESAYEMNEVLGEGGFNIVYRCTHRETKRSYAVKEIITEDYDYQFSGENIKDEIAAYRRLCDCSYVTRLYDVFEEPSRTFLIMEQMTGGDLLDKLEERSRYSVREARRVSRTLLEALRYCHKRSIAHRDIKPENILLVHRDDDYSIKLADFGCAKRITKPYCFKTLCGSPGYVAPEVLTHTDGYTEQCDAWSAGVVLYVVLSGYAPFEGPDLDLPILICSGIINYEADPWGEIPQDVKDFLKSLLTIDPKERSTPQQALESKWLKRNYPLLSSNLGDSTTSFQSWMNNRPRNSTYSSSSRSLLFDDSTHSRDSIHSFYGKNEDLNNNNNTNSSLYHLQNTSKVHTLLEEDSPDGDHQDEGNQEEDDDDNESFFDDNDNSQRHISFPITGKKIGEEKSESKNSALAVDEESSDSSSSSSSSEEESDFAPIPSKRHSMPVRIIPQKEAISFAYLNYDYDSSSSDDSDSDEEEMVAYKRKYNKLSPKNRGKRVSAPAINAAAAVQAATKLSLSSDDKTQTTTTKEQSNFESSMNVKAMDIVVNPVF